MTTMGNGVGVGVEVGVGVAVAVGVGRGVAVGVGETSAGWAGVAAKVSWGKTRVGTNVGSPRAERLHARLASTSKTNAINGKIQFRRLIKTHYPWKHWICQRTITHRLGDICLTPRAYAAINSPRQHPYLDPKQNA
jgi:hypothetical protein